MKLICPTCRTRIPDHLLRTRPSGPDGGVIVTCPQCHTTSRRGSYLAGRVAATGCVFLIALLVGSAADMSHALRMLAAVAAPVAVGVMLYATRGARTLTPLQNAHAILDEPPS